jgi:TonB family protein
MKRLAFFVALFAPITGLGATARVPAADATMHLTKHTRPVYPPLAQQTRISGTVILEIEISEVGKVAIRRVISGHPLLQQAAIDAVKRWEFKPFQFGGQPTAVITWVKVGFGNNPKQDSDADAELRSLFDFWTALDGVRRFIISGELQAAAERLKAAEDLLASMGNQPHRSFPVEQAEWLSLSANLAAAQGNLSEAEDKYLRAFKITEQADQNPPTTARTLALLKKDYGAAIASTSLLLAKASAQHSDQGELDKNCREAISFKDYLSEPDRATLAVACQQPAPK